jgi:hypothetical protein
VYWYRVQLYILTVLDLDLVVDVDLVTGIMLSGGRAYAARRGTLSVLAARGRAQVSVAAATTGGQSSRDMRYADQDDHGTAG